MAFRFEHLDIWKESVDFSKEIYDLVKKFPKKELFALNDQLRRASTSVSANIAEGSGSSSNKGFRNYLSIAVKSVFEVVSLLAVSNKNRYITNDTFLNLRNRAELLVKRIQAFRNSLSQ